MARGKTGIARRVGPSSRGRVATSIAGRVASSARSITVVAPSRQSQAAAASSISTADGKRAARSRHTARSMRSTTSGDSVRSKAVMGVGDS